jgi:excinuclease ABC subunit A
MKEKIKKSNPIKTPVSSETKTDLQTGIFIKGARVNNLQNIDLNIPRNRLVVVTGVSGSGKSSITMDTLYAEGQRRYVESLSSYARQFLMRMKKPDIDYIKGICPAIAIEQKVTTGNNRSTVGSMTEIYDYLRLLYARIGKTYSPISGNLVKKHQVSDIIDFILSNSEGDKVLLYTVLPKKYKDRTLAQELKLLLQKGYTRIATPQGEMLQIEDFLADAKNKTDLALSIGELTDKDYRILIDRFVVKKDDLENTKRIADSVQTAFDESEGEAIIEILGSNIDSTNNKQQKTTNNTKRFNNRFELDGMEFIEPAPQLFNYNNPFGACPVCEGYGKVMGIDADKVIPDQNQTVAGGAISCWKGEKSSEWLQDLLRVAAKFDFPVHKPYNELTKQQQKLLWTGNQYFHGITRFFSELEAQTYKIQNRVMLARYRGRTTCLNCDGARLRPEATYIKVSGKSINELVDIPIDQLATFFNSLQISESDTTIAKRLILEMQNRLKFMIEVGLPYLTLSRISATLSGGETQRINLTRTLSSNLTSSLYILDEPSVGLHPRDTERLVGVLKSLRNLGNTVVVVEHEEDVIKNADYLIDIGPQAGVHGGRVVFAGNFKEIYTTPGESLTAAYMNGSRSIPIPKHRRKATSFITIKGAKQHNLKNITATFPLNVMTVVTGVSGSGKTTLVKQILHPALLKNLDQTYTTVPGLHDSLEGDLKRITQVEMINQSPIGKSSRSNPVTYVKAYDAIRALYAKQQLSKIRGYKDGHFSFNTDGGRCDTCKGEGEQVVEMQFLADVRLECEECKGKRFKSDTLEVEYKGKNIFEVLEMSIEDALDFFKDIKEIYTKIKPLNDVGLGYVKLGQSSSTLSGGEAQRVKLASFLVRENTKEHVFFIFDEPTTGLHFHDIQKLLDAMQALVEKGHTVLVVEHNMEVIKSADWVLDLGPDGGINGGHLVFSGTPEALTECKESITAPYLKEKLGN